MIKVAYILPVNMSRFGYNLENYLDSHFSVLIAKEVVKAGHDVSIHTFWNNNFTHHYDGVKIHFHKTSFNRIFHEDFSEISMSLLKEKFESDRIIHFSEPTRIFFPSFILNKKNKLILQHHGEGIGRPFPITSIFYIPYLLYGFFLMKHLLNKASRIIVSNNKARLSFEKNGIASSKIIKYHRGIDLPKYKDYDKNNLRKELNINTQDVVFIYAGRITKIKGIKELISAYEKLKKINEKIKLVLLGPLEDEELYKIVKPYWLGFKNTSELQKWLSVSDVFILPSYFEAFGIVLLQALYYNLPIIATKVGGISEFVPETKSIFIEPKSTQSLFSAMQKMLNENFRKSKSHESRKMVVEKYTWKSVADTYIKIYQSL